jgi:fucose permease
VTLLRRPRPVPAGILGCLALLLIGWTGLLVPALIRSIKETYDQTDAGIGLVFFLYSIAYATGSLGGGPVTERLGRRTVLVSAALLHGAGIAGLGLAGSWELFVLATLPAGLGAGSIDGGANGLFLDLFREGRGRAMNLLHLSFSIGALSAPLVVGALVVAGVPWQAIVVGSGVALVPLALGFAFVSMPGGRHQRGARAAHEEDGVSAATSRASSARLLTVPLILLGLAIACYVASEVGVSNWLVRFLEPAPLSTATLALSLFWAGIAVGRLISSQIADRFDHLAFTTTCALVLAVTLAGAIVVPSVPVSIALFALAGLASGPIFPMIVAIGGERFPDRSAAVGGVLTGLGVVGGTIYPPLMGVLSVTVGLWIAMFGNVLLALACAAFLVAVARTGRPS